MQEYDKTWDDIQKALSKDLQKQFSEPQPASDLHEMDEALLVKYESPEQYQFQSLLATLPEHLREDVSSVGYLPATVSGQTTKFCYHVVECPDGEWNKLHSFSSLEEVVGYLNSLKDNNVEVYIFYGTYLPIYCLSGYPEKMFVQHPFRNAVMSVDMPVEMYNTYENRIKIGQRYYQYEPIPSGGFLTIRSFYKRSDAAAAKALTQQDKKKRGRS